MTPSPLLARLGCAIAFLSAALLGCSTSAGGGTGTTGGTGASVGTGTTGGTGAGGSTGAGGGTGGLTLKPLVGSNILVDGTSLLLIDDSDHAGALERVDVASGEVTTLFHGSDPHQVLGAWIQADAARFYFVVDGRIVALPRAGGTPVPLTPQGNYNEFLVNTSNLYWYAGGGVMQAPLPQGGAGTLIPGTPGQPGSFAVDDETMFWVVPGSGSTNEIVSAPVAGGPTTMLATGLQDFPSLVLGSDAIYLVDDGPGSVDCGVGPGSIASVPRSGGSVQMLAQNLYDLGPNAVSGTTAVFAGKAAPTECDGDGIPGPWLVSRVDGNGPAKQIGTSYWAQELATDGTDVYLQERTSDEAPPTLRVLK